MTSQGNLNTTKGLVTRETVKSNTVGRCRRVILTNIKFAEIMGPGK